MESTNRPYVACHLQYDHHGRDLTEQVSNLAYLRNVDVSYVFAGASPCGNTYVKMGEAVERAFQDGGKLKLPKTTSRMSRRF